LIITACPSPKGVPTNGPDDPGPGNGPGGGFENDPEQYDPFVIMRNGIRFYAEEGVDRSALWNDVNDLYAGHVAEVAPYILRFTRVAAGSLAGEAARAVELDPATGQKAIVYSTTDDIQLAWILGQVRQEVREMLGLGDNGNGGNGEDPRLVAEREDIRFYVDNDVPEALRPVVAAELAGLTDAQLAEFTSYVNEWWRIPDGYGRHIFPVGEGRVMILSDGSQGGILADLEAGRAYIREGAMVSDTICVNCRTPQSA